MTDDPNYVFPLLDDLPPPGPPSVPPGFDLVALLSESMRARPQWRDYAAMSSRIIYEYVERSRLALQSSRDPTVLDRTLKIATLRMCGLDWNTDLLTDDDYDRALEGVAEFFQTNGPQDFARYLGYALGVPMDLIPLWTQDYAEFAPGPPMTSGGVDDGTVFSPTPGPSYPTAHVDLVVDAYAARAGRLDNDAARADIERAFYQVAPIHLVMKWVARQINLSVGNLWMQLGLLQESEVTLGVERRNKLDLYLIPGFRATSEINLELQPPAPSRTVNAGTGVVAHDIGAEAATCDMRGAWFRPAYDLVASGLSVSSGGGWVPSTIAGSGPRESLQPDPAYANPVGRRGLLILPASTLYVNMPTDPRPLASSGCSITVGPSLPDGNVGWTVACASAGGALTASPPDGPRSEQTVQWTFVPHDSAHKTIVRGARSVSLSVSNGAPTVTRSGVDNDACGAYALGGNAWTLWMRTPSTGAVAVSPGSDAPGAVDWLTLQVEDSPWPTPVGARNATSVPYARQGNTTSLDPDQLSKPCGVIAVRATRRWPSRGATQVVFDAQTTLGNRTTLSLKNDVPTLTATLRDPLALGTVGADGDLGAAVIWSPTGVRLLVGSAEVDAAQPYVLPNYAILRLFCGVSTAPADLWTLRTALLVGASAASELPTDDVIRTILTQADP